MAVSERDLHKWGIYPRLPQPLERLESAWRQHLVKIEVYYPTLSEIRQYFRVLCETGPIMLRTKSHLAIVIASFMVRPESLAACLCSARVQPNTREQAASALNT